MATVLNFVDQLAPEQRRRPPHLKHEGGWYRLERRIWHNDTVCKDFQESAVWAYLIGMAEYQPSGRQRRLGGSEVHVGYGTIATSENALARYVGWSNHRVHRFLERLAEAGRITVKPVQHSSIGRPRSVQRGILITLCNHAYYQRDEEGPSNDRPENVQATSNIIKKEERKEGKGVGIESRIDSVTPDGGKESHPHSCPPAAPPDAPAAAVAPTEKRKGKTKLERSLSPERLAEFETFWNAWKAFPGARRKRGDAEASFKTAREVRGVSLDLLVRRVNQYLFLCRQEGRELRYVMLPSTWLNNACWEDDAPAELQRDEQAAAGPPYWGVPPEDWRQLRRWERQMVEWRARNPRLIGQAAEEKARHAFRFAPGADEIPPDDTTDVEAAYA